MGLNADIGESWKDRIVGNDAALMPLLDACNIACGFHAGDALTMQRTIDLALQHGVRIGAHPSFPDRKHFGRQRMNLPLDELEALLLYQVGALDGMVRAAGGTVKHIKPHGALYHYTDEVPEAAQVMVRVARKLKIGAVFGPPGGALMGAVAGAGLKFKSEGFADRRYGIVTAEHESLALPARHATERARRASTPEHSAHPPALLLRKGAGREDQPTPRALKILPRSHPAAIICSPAEAAAQVRRLLTCQEVVAADGTVYPLKVQTVCVHGDHDGAVGRAAAVRAVLDEYR